MRSTISDLYLFFLHLFTHTQHCLAYNDHVFTDLYISKKKIVKMSDEYKENVLIKNDRWI